MPFSGNIQRLFTGGNRNKPPSMAKLALRSVIAHRQHISRARQKRHARTISK
jgi:hypothetical protein